MIFGIKTDISIKGLGGQCVSMSLSFSSGDADFYEIHDYSIRSRGAKMLVCHAGHVCSDTYYAFSEFDRDAFPDLLKALAAGPQGNMLTILESLKGYRLVACGKTEDFPDGFPDGKFLTEDAVRARLDDINRSLADRYNTDEDLKDPYFMETNPNGFHVDILNRTVEFSFTVMNEKFWDDLGFDRIRDEYGLDLDDYLDYFER